MFYLLLLINKIVTCVFSFGLDPISLFISRYNTELNSEMRFFISEKCYFLINDKAHDFSEKILDLFPKKRSVHF